MGFVRDASATRVCRAGLVSGSFGSQGAAGSCRVRPDGSGRRYSGRARARSVRSVRLAGRLRMNRGPERGRHQDGTVTERLLGLDRLLGLKRPERRSAPPELGHRRPAIAQQRLERARAVAVADQGEPKPAMRDLPLLEQLGFNAVRPRQAPGGDRDPAREHALERADRRQLRDQRRLDPGELGSILVREQEMLLRAQAWLRAFCADLALPSGVLGPRDVAPLRRLASARALVTVTAARDTAPALDMAVILGLKTGAGWRAVAALGRVALEKGAV